MLDFVQRLQHLNIHSSFDSILVRLKVIFHFGIHAIDLFRFHTGSIKRNQIRTPSVRHQPMFRFHTGSIKSAVSDSLYLLGVRRFRFHTGSIKRDTTATGKSCGIRFDSILVRLKESHLRNTIRTTHIYVSIPYWFD